VWLIVFSRSLVRCVKMKSLPASDTQYCNTFPERGFRYFVITTPAVIRKTALTVFELYVPGCR